MLQKFWQALDPHPPSFWEKPILKLRLFVAVRVKSPTYLRQCFSRVVEQAVLFGSGDGGGLLFSMILKLFAASVAATCCGCGRVAEDQVLKSKKLLTILTPIPPSHKKKDTFLQMYSLKLQ